jgi:hypothetical protein
LGRDDGEACLLGDSHKAEMSKEEEGEKRGRRRRELATLFVNGCI